MSTHPPNASDSLLFNKRGTIAYFLYHLRSLPDVYSSLDTNRITVCYFCLSALDLLDAMDAVQRPEEIIEWIYSLQCIPQKSSTTATTTTTTKTNTPPSLLSATKLPPPPTNTPEWGYSNNQCSPCNTNPDSESCRHCGFLGSAYLGGRRFDENKKAIPLEAKGSAHGHTAMTYTALTCLIILGDDLSRVARKPILKSLNQLQQKDGRFVAHHNGGESDCRFMYCACAIAFMLGGVAEHVDTQKVEQYITSCVSYDGGIGLVPGQESHGGSTYTALAGLGLCAEGLQEPLNVKTRIGMTEHAIAKWCLARQLEEWNVGGSRKGGEGEGEGEGEKEEEEEEEKEENVNNGGFQGRLNKAADTCYTFWILGALQVLDNGGDTTADSVPSHWLDMFDRDAIRFFLLDENVGTQDCKRGGFGKAPGDLPDILHSYYGVCGLALIGDTKDGVLALDASLSISQRSRDRLKEIQQVRGWI